MLGNIAKAGASFATRGASNLLFTDDDEEEQDSTKVSYKKGKQVIEQVSEKAKNKFVDKLSNYSIKVNIIVNKTITPGRPAKRVVKYQTIIQFKDKTIYSIKLKEVSRVRTKADKNSAELRHDYIWGPNVYSSSIAYDNIEYKQRAILEDIFKNIDRFLKYDDFKGQVFRGDVDEETKLAMQKYENKIRELWDSYNEASNAYKKPSNSTTAYDAMTMINKQHVDTIESIEE